MSWARKLRAIMPVDVLLTHQPQVSLIDERRGLQRVAGSLSTHVVVRQPVKLRLNQRQQLIQGRLIATAPIREQLRYFVWGRLSHLVP